MVYYLCGTCFHESADCPHWTIETTTATTLYCMIIKRQSAQLDIKCYCGCSTTVSPQKQATTYQCQSPNKCTNQLIFSSRPQNVTPDQVKLLLKVDPILLKSKTGRFHPQMCNHCNGQGHLYNTCAHCTTNYWKRLQCQFCYQEGSTKVGCQDCHSSGQIWHIY